MRRDTPDVQNSTEKGEHDTVAATRTMLVAWCTAGRHRSPGLQQLGGIGQRRAGAAAVAPKIDGVSFDPCGRQPFHAFTIAAGMIAIAVDDTDRGDRLWWPDRADE